MPEYLEDVVERFDPMDYITPSEEEMDEHLPENPTREEILETKSEIRSPKKRGGAILAGKILAELLHLSTEVREEIEILTPASHVEWSGEQKDDVHLFFTYVGQVQEYLIREAVFTHILSDDVRTDEMKQKIMGGRNERGMPVHECLEYLHKGDAIGDGLKGEIGQVRDERNETVHDITRWFFANFDPEDLEAQVSRGERTVVRLLELIYGFELE